MMTFLPWMRWTNAMQPARAPSVMRTLSPLRSGRLMKVALPVSMMRRKLLNSASGMMWGVFLPGIVSILYTSGRKRMSLRWRASTLTKTKVERTTNSRMQRLPRLLTTTRLSVGTQASIGRPRPWKSCSMASMNFFS